MGCLPLGWLFVQHQRKAVGLVGEMGERSGCGLPDGFISPLGTTEGSEQAQLVG